jgi:hypothetical protein
MTHAEAKEMLRNEGMYLSDNDMEYVFNNVGTNPAMLLKLIAEVPSEMNLQEFVEGLLSTARADLSISLF